MLSICLLVVLLSGKDVLGLLSNSPVKVGEDPTPPFNFSVFPECNFTANATEVPKLAKEFTLKVEIKLGNTIIDSDGYYEHDGQRGASYVLQNGTQSAFLYDFTSGWAFDIHGRTCDIGDLFTLGCNPYAVFIAEIAGHSNISDNCSISTGDTNYSGEMVNFTVRGIRVRKWSQCVHDNKKNETSLSTYYYNSKTMTPPSGAADVPIRFETSLLDTTRKGTTSIYDFTYYLPEIEDKNVFLPAQGVFCPAWNRENKTMPKLPDQFSMTMLTICTKTHEVHNIKLNFDYDSKLSSFITDSFNGTNFPPSHVSNKTLFRIVHDYNTGLSFSMPVETWLLGTENGCTIDAISNSSLDSHPSNSSVVHISHSDALFGMSHGTWIYIGQRDFNNMATYVWTSQKNNTKKNLITTTEVYWLHENYTSGNTPIFAGMMIYQNMINGTEIDTYQTIVSDYSTFPFFHWRTFDVDSCLKNDNQQMITFTVRVPNYVDVVSFMASFETAIRDTLANLTGASPLRFTDIMVEKGSEMNKPQVWLTVLDWVNKTGSVQNATVQIPAALVVQNLRKMFEGKDLDVTMEYARKNQTVTFLKNTLQSGSDLVRPTTAAPPIVSTTPGVTIPPQPVATEGYTSGSMAGLAIAMIIIGGIAGLVAGFLLWKRNTGIAYQVYD